MYNVSDEFLNKMIVPAQRRRCYGYIGGKRFTNKNIIQGSTMITNQCSGGTDIAIGQVYVGTLNITLRGISGITRRWFRDKEIILYQGLEIDDGVYEDVLLGHFFVSEANWTESGVSIVAYDVMSRFDKNMTATLGIGYVYDFLTMACRECHVEFGMTSEDISWLPNGLIEFMMYDENDIQTWRDLISWCAQTVGCNATINRQGKLILVKYGQDSVDVYDTRRRLSGASFSDFESYYTGLSVVNISDQTTSYYGLEEDTGLTMNLGSNPLLQYGTKQQLENLRRAILNAISEINYTPAKVSLNALMIYDLMDVLEFTDGIAGDGAVVCITKFTWRLNGSYTIECVGSDPALASAKSKVDKNLAGILSTVDENKMHYYVYRNVQRYDIQEDSTKRIISIKYAVKRDTYIEFHATVQYTSETSEIEYDTYEVRNTGGVRAKYSIDEIEQEFSVYENNEDGVNLLHLVYIWTAEANTQGEFAVDLSAILSDITIYQGNVLAYITGQGLVGEGDWDGNISVYEEFEDGIEILPIFDRTGFADVPNVETIYNRIFMYNQNVNGIRINTPEFSDSNQSIDENCMIFTTIVNLSLLTYTATISDVSFVEGEIVTPNIYGVTGVEVKAVGGKYLASFDNGQTWEAYVVGTGWTTGTFMTRQEIQQVPQSEWQSPVMIKVIVSNEDEESLSEIVLKGGSINV